MINLIKLLPLRKEPVDHFDFGYASMYKLFYSFFDIKQKCIESVKFYKENYDDYIEIGRYLMVKNENIVFDDFFSYRKGIEIIADCFAREDGIFELDAIPIGMCAGNIFIFVGTGVDNADLIYLENNPLPEDGGRLTVIYENIFDFVKNFWIKFEDPQLFGYFSYDNFYQNWNEKFWRVKDDLPKE